MDKSSVWLKVAGRWCLGQIVEYIERQGSQWVIVQPIYGFAIEKALPITETF